MNKSRRHQAKRRGIRHFVTIGTLGSWDWSVTEYDVTKPTPNGYEGRFLTGVEADAFLLRLDAAPPPSAD